MGGGLLRAGVENRDGAADDLRLPAADDLPQFPGGVGMNERRSKYGAHRTETGGITFDSAAEAARYRVLYQLQQAGLIRNLRRQVAYPLEVNRVRVSVYKADFVYEALGQDGGWSEVVEDVKSPATAAIPLYRLKRRLMLACHGIEIREVS